MALPAGTKLGPYEIVDPLGAGGMGEVYRAKDTRLNRIVAIKVLPTHLSSNPELRRRFEREARAVSSLNHPYICALYDIGNEDGIDFIVMEYIEGETLTHRLQKNSLSTSEVLQYSIQIADALDKAHRKGIVHRDLKPGNIMLTRSGAKLLDFGLAKEKSFGPGASKGLSELPTASEALTAEGTILGTIPYMAPEQLEGKQADARTDIWSFGALLYEMATGKRAFNGKSQASLITAIMSSKPPPVSSIQPLSPTALDQVVKTCLEKDPDDRFQSAHDLMLELRWISEGTTSAGVMTVPSKPKLSWIASILTALIVGFIAGWWIARKQSTDASAAVIRSILSLPSGYHLSGWQSPVITFSPDGKKIAFIAEKEDGMNQLFIQTLDRDVAQLVPDSQEAEGPFFSPDSQWVGFAVGVSGGVRKGELKKYSLVSGLSQTICETPDYFGADWGKGDLIIFSSEALRLRKVSANGGKAEYLAPREVGEKKYLEGAWPQILPDGKWVLTSNDVRPQATLINLSSMEIKDLNVASIYTRFAGTDHLLYVRPDATLMAAPFHPETLTFMGPSVALLKDICLSGADAAVFSFSQNGSFIYTTGYLNRSGREPMNLVRITRNGDVEPLSLKPELFGRYPSVSRDGKKLAVAGWDGSLWVYDLKRNTRINLPSGKTLRRDYPLWTPDGKAIFFGSISDQDYDVFYQIADGIQEPQHLNVGEGESHPFSWTPDGRTLLYDLFRQYSNEPRGIFLLPLQPRGQPRVLLRSFESAYGNPAVSPDGKWFAYVSAETGVMEVFLQRFPQLGEKIQISKGGGTTPRWSTTGSELIYRNGNRFLSVALTTSPQFHADEPKLLFELDGVRGFDTGPDDSFYAIRRIPGTGIQTQLHLVINWFNELKRLAPPTK